MEIMEMCTRKMWPLGWEKCVCSKCKKNSTTLDGELLGTIPAKSRISLDYPITVEVAIQGGTAHFVTVPNKTFKIENIDFDKSYFTPTQPDSRIILADDEVKRRHNLALMVQGARIMQQVILAKLQNERMPREPYGHAKAAVALDIEMIDQLNPNDIIKE